MNYVWCFTSCVLVIVLMERKIGLSKNVASKKNSVRGLEQGNFIWSQKHGRITPFLQRRVKRNSKSDPFPCGNDHEQPPSGSMAKQLDEYLARARVRMECLEGGIKDWADRFFIIDQWIDKPKLWDAVRKRIVDIKNEEFDVKNDISNIQTPLKRMKKAIQDRTQQNQRVQSLIGSLQNLSHEIGRQAEGMMWSDLHDGDSGNSIPVEQRHKIVGLFEVGWLELRQFLVSYRIWLDRADELTQRKATIRGVPDNEFQPKEAAKTLYDAIHIVKFAWFEGIITLDAEALIRELTRHSKKQISEIKRTYAILYRMELFADLRSEKGWTLSMTSATKLTFEGLLMTPTAFDAKQLKNMGTGDDDKLVLTDIIVTRSYSELRSLHWNIIQYSARFYSESALYNTGTNKVRFRQFVTCAILHRKEPDSHDVDWQLAKIDAQRLIWAYYQAYEPDAQTRLPEWTAEMLKDDPTVLYDPFPVILCRRSLAQIRATVFQYNRIVRQTKRSSELGAFETIVSTWCSKTSCPEMLKKTIIALVRYAQSPQTYYADVLYNSIKGSGTFEGPIINTLIRRREVDLEAIKEKYLKIHEEQLEDAVGGEFYLGRTDDLLADVMKSRKYDQHEEFF